MDILSSLKGKSKLLGNMLPKANSPTASAGPGSPGVVGRFIFMDFCKPAKVYMLLAFLSMIYYVSIQQGLVWLIIKAILFILWTFLVNKLCTSGNKMIAWVLAIIPQCIFLICTIQTSPATNPHPVPAQAAF
jgi:hypothetical protein